MTLKERYGDQALEMRMTSEATVLQDTAEWKCTDVLSAANKAASHACDQKGQGFRGLGVSGLGVEHSVSVQSRISKVCILLQSRF